VSRNARVVFALLLAIAAAVLGPSVLCDWAIAHGASMRWRWAFRLLCRGIPERCFDLFGIAMPICARCTGIYAGLAIGACAFLVAPLVRERWMRIAMFLAVTPLAIDGITQAMRLRESTNGLRVGTGLLSGIAFAMWVLTSVEQAARERQMTGFPMS
jgi:uncharacterized membrane protein